MDIDSRRHLRGGSQVIVQEKIENSEKKEGGSSAEA